MNKMSVWVLVASMAFAATAAASLPGQGRPGLEQRIKEVFLRQPDDGGDVDKRAEIAALGHEEQVSKILLSFLTRYRYPQTTEEELYLDGAVDMLGELRVAEAVAPLARILLDGKVAERTHAWAAKSLGRIDPEAGKEALLAALDPKVSDFHLTRINAAEALADTKDPEVLKALERHGREERDPYVRQKLLKAADRLRARLDR
jgi:HEAT repeat protein